jgi:hypothetical protein
MKITKEKHNSPKNQRVKDQCNSNNAGQITRKDFRKTCSIGQVCI